jgi:hypothetical protein
MVTPTILRRRVNSRQAVTSIDPTHVFCRSSERDVDETMHRRVCTYLRYLGALGRQRNMGKYLQDIVYGMACWIVLCGVSISILKMLVREALQLFMRLVTSVIVHVPPSVHHVCG